MFAAAVSWTRKAGFSVVLGVTLVLASFSIQARGFAGDSAVGIVALADIPFQGRRTHALILAGGPFPYDKDGMTFGNRERLLPASKRGFYREYTVRTPGARNRGARRIVCGGPPRTPEACYYTSDHYTSFRRIVD